MFKLFNASHKKQQAYSHDHHARYQSVDRHRGHCGHWEQTLHPQFFTPLFLSLTIFKTAKTTAKATITITMPSAALIVSPSL
jgi:hypothetical protein